MTSRKWTLHLWLLLHFYEAAEVKKFFLQWLIFLLLQTCDSWFFGIDWTWVLWLLLNDGYCFFSATFCSLISLWLSLLFYSGTLIKWNDCFSHCCNILFDQQSVLQIYYWCEKVSMYTWPTTTYGNSALFYWTLKEFELVNLKLLQHPHFTGEIMDNQGGKQSSQIGLVSAVAGISFECTVPS